MKLRVFKPSKVAKQAAITLDKNGILTVDGSVLEPFQVKEVQKLNVLLDEEQETIQSELLVYVSFDDNGYYILGKPTKNRRKINLQSLLKINFPSFKKGNLSYRTEEIEGQNEGNKYLIITIPAGNDKL